MDKENYILSIVIPTYNRANVLIHTLSFFESQIQRNEDKIELIVCNNASSDNTKDVIEEYQLSHSYVTAVNYSDHVDVGDSIVRSVENACGKFFLVFGDDEIPAPYMVDTILDSIQKYPDIGKIVFNRLVGTTLDYNYDMESLHVVGSTDFSEGVVYYKDSTLFADDHQIEFGFVSVNVVRRDLWNRYYKSVYPNNNIGFEFLVPYVYAAKDAPSIYIQYPLCIQRRPSLHAKNVHHDFQDAKACLYAMLGRPRSIKYQGELNLLNDWRKTYWKYLHFGGRTDEQIRRFFFYDSLNNYQVLLPYVDELCDFQLEENADIILMFRRLLQLDGVNRKVWTIYYKIKYNDYRWIMKYPFRIIKRWFS